MPRCLPAAARVSRQGLSELGLLRQQLESGGAHERKGQSQRNPVVGRAEQSWAGHTKAGEDAAAAAQELPLVLG